MKPRTKTAKRYRESFIDKIGPGVQRSVAYLVNIEKLYRDCSDDDMQVAADVLKACIADLRKLGSTGELPKRKKDKRGK